MIRRLLACNSNVDQVRSLPAGAAGPVEDGPGQLDRIDVDEAAVHRVLIAWQPGEVHEPSVAQLRSGEPSEAEVPFAHDPVEAAALPPPLPVARFPVAPFPVAPELGRLPAGPLEVIGGYLPLQDMAAMSQVNHHVHENLRGIVANRAAAPLRLLELPVPSRQRMGARDAVRAAGYDPDADGCNVYALLQWQRICGHELRIHPGLSQGSWFERDYAQWVTAGCPPHDFHGEIAGAGGVAHSWTSDTTVLVLRKDGRLFMAFPGLHPQPEAILLRERPSPVVQAAVFGHRAALLDANGTLTIAGIRGTRTVPTPGDGVRGLLAAGPHSVLLAGGLQVWEVEREFSRTCLLRRDLQVTHADTTENGRLRAVLSDGSELIPSEYPSRARAANYLHVARLRFPGNDVAVTLLVDRATGAPVIHCESPVAVLPTPGLPAEQVEWAHPDGADAVRFVLADGRSYKVGTGTAPGFYADGVLQPDAAAAALPHAVHLHRVPLPPEPGVVRQLQHFGATVPGLERQCREAGFGVADWRITDAGRLVLLCRAHFPIPELGVPPRLQCASSAFVHYELFVERLRVDHRP